eukprot:1141894-Pelagomonas_calceolata.AAC.4
MRSHWVAPIGLVGSTASISSIKENSRDSTGRRTVLMGAPPDTLQAYTNLQEKELVPKHFSTTPMAEPSNPLPALAALQGTTVRATLVSFVDFTVDTQAVVLVAPAQVPMSLSFN